MNRQRYKAQWHQDRINGAPGRRVDLDELTALTDHLDRLRRGGMTAEAIAARAGVSAWTVRRAYRAMSMTRTHAEALWGVRLAEDGGALDRFAVVGTRRRLGALLALGHRQPVVGRAMRMSSLRLRQLLTGERDHVQRATYDRALEVYDQLSMVPGGDEATMAWAREHGFPPPLAWEEGELDDPDPAVQQRAFTRAR